MGMPVYFTKALTAADDDIIAASQTPGGAGNLTLISSTVTLDTPRQVILTFAADETGHSFVLYGNSKIDGTGTPIYETIAGTTAGVVASTRMYGQVTRISISAAATGAIKAGTNGVGASDWFIPDYQVTPFILSIGAVVTGTVNYTIEYTYDDYWSVVPNTGQGAVPVAFSDAILAAIATTGQTSINVPVTGWRLKINSGTGSVAISAVQAGMFGA